MYKLRDWVDETRLCISLSLNERAVEYLENHEHLISNVGICGNENAIHIIEKRIHILEKLTNYDKYYNINYNKNAITFLRNNRQYINYNTLCRFEHGIEFVDELIKNNELDKIDWRTLSRNPAAMHIINDPKYNQCICWGGLIHNKNAVDLVKNNLHMIKQYWDIICMQPHLTDVIKQNKNKINWRFLSRNYNAIHILEKNIHKISVICIDELCMNKYGFKILLLKNHNFHNYNIYHKNIVFDYFDYCEKNNKPFNLINHLSECGYTEKHMDFLKHNNNYYYLSMNPNIFEYDYKRMRETRQSLLWYNDIKK